MRGQDLDRSDDHHETAPERAIRLGQEAIHSADATLRSLQQLVHESRANARPSDR